VSETPSGEPRSSERGIGMGDVVPIHDRISQRSLCTFRQPDFVRHSYRAFANTQFRGIAE
jgi:hypothetical protein